MVTFNVKTLFIILVLIALIVLIVYAIFVLRKLLVTLEHTNKVLEDTGVISEIAASRSQDLDGIITDVSKAASDISSATSTRSGSTSPTGTPRRSTTRRGWAGSLPTARSGNMQTKSGEPDENAESSP